MNYLSVGSLGSKKSSAALPHHLLPVSNIAECHVTRSGAKVKKFGVIHGLQHSTIAAQQRRATPDQLRAVKLQELDWDLPIQDTRRGPAQGLAAIAGWRVLRWELRVVWAQLS